MRTYKFKSLPNEVWKTLPILSGIYEVSNLGRFRRTATKRLIKPFMKDNGYYYVKPYINGRAINFRLHRLVAMAFIIKPPNKNEVNHIDGDKANNTAVNLEWVSKYENMWHAIKNHLWKVRSKVIDFSLPIPFV